MSSEVTVDEGVAAHQSVTLCAIASEGGKSNQTGSLGGLKGLRRRQSDAFRRFAQMTSPLGTKTKRGDQMKTDGGTMWYDNNNPVMLHPREDWPVNSDGEEYQRFILTSKGDMKYSCHLHR